MLTWVIFIKGISFYDFQHQISQLHLIGKFQNSVWGTTLTQSSNDSLWPWPKSQPCQRTRPEKVAFLNFHGKRPKLWLSESHTYLSSPMSELHEIFFGDSPITTLNSIFPGHVSAPHRFWEKRHGWNHGNPKMPLSLALFSDMVGISAKAIKSRWIYGLMLFPIPSLMNFQ